MEKEYCYRCGKRMTADDDTATIGIKVALNGLETASPAQKRFYQLQYGQYPIDITYRFCCECMLDALSYRAGPRTDRGKNK